MPNPPNSTVREIQPKDINLLVAYWLNSDPDYLLGMGADPAKIPSEVEFRAMLHKQIDNPIDEKQSFALIWELDGKPVGHSNVNRITFGVEATMHLHLWYPDNRQKGLGSQLLIKSLPFYFEKLQIKKLICEPYALNPAPNKILKRIGFQFIKKYTTIPGSSNFEQEVNRYELTREDFKSNFLPE